MTDRGERTSLLHFILFFKNFGRKINFASSQFREKESTQKFLILFEIKNWKDLITDTMPTLGEDGFTSFGQEIFVRQTFGRRFLMRDLSMKWWGDNTVTRLGEFLIFGYFLLGYCF